MEPEPDLDVDFVRVKQTPIDAKLRVSEPLQLPNEDPIYYNLLAVSNKFGFVVFGTSQGFAFAYTKDVRAALSQASARQCIELSSKRDYPVLDDVVNQIRLSANNETVIIGLISGKILLYKAAGLASGNKKPHKTLQFPDEEDIVVLPNPEAFPDICAINSADGALYLLSLSTGEFKHIDAFESEITSICWSRKGKQLAVGDNYGVVRQVSVEGLVKNTISLPPVLDNTTTSVAVSHIFWLEDKVFTIVYHHGDESDAFIVTQTGTVKKGLTTEHIRLTDPCPYPDADRHRGNYYNTLITEMGDIPCIVPFANFASTSLGFLGKHKGSWNSWKLGEWNYVAI
ncbi:hypothetical protein BDR26DRAFT_290659 [Obelidium mucronatum]|nr:hypothetical protein BDR26DRAFT_290659 [Obelidium mucronatum]